MGKPIISGIVSNYNGWELNLLKNFYKAFLKDDFKNFELILVDNASTDGSAEKVEKHFGKDKRVLVVRNPENKLSAGINLGYKASSGKYLLFLNNDIYFQKGALKKMVDFMDKSPKVALVQGKLVSYYDHKKIDDVGETMDIYGNPVTLGAGEEDKGQYNETTEPLSVTGSSSMYRASLVKTVGLTDPEYSIGYEDMDLAIRSRIAGYKAHFLPDVVAYHCRAATTSILSPKIKRKIKFDFNKNRLSTLIKNYQPATLFISLPIVVLIYIAAGLFEMFYKRLWGFGWTRFKALGWVVINLPTLLEKRRKVQKLRKLPDRVAFLPFMAKGKMAEGFKNFIGSKKW